MFRRLETGTIDAKGDMEFRDGNERKMSLSVGLHDSRTDDSLPACGEEGDREGGEGDDEAGGG